MTIKSIIGRIFGKSAAASGLAAICCVRAHGTITVHRNDGTVEVEECDNLITNAGRIQLHTQCYGTTSLLTNGFCYIALSNDTLTETASSTTLSTEIAANGLSRAIGTVTLPTGSGTQTTISKTFTASGAQSAQKAALFTASSAGVMNHALAFTQKTLASGESLTVTFTITTS
jgi:hypothetical protein